MAKDNYFKIVYVILTELYESTKAGERVDLQNISAERFQIKSGYLLAILAELLDNGYIKGLIIRDTKTGRVVSNLGFIPRGFQRVIKQKIRFRYCCDS